MGQAVSQGLQRALEPPQLRVTADSANQAVHLGHNGGHVHAIGERPQGAFECLDAGLDGCWCVHAWLPLLCVACFTAAALNAAWNAGSCRWRSSARAAARSGTGEAA